MDKLKFQKIMELLKDEQFVESLKNVSSEEQLKETFLSNGVEATIDDLEECKSKLLDVANGKVALSEKELELIVGGEGEEEFDFAQLQNILNQVTNLVVNSIQIHQARTSIKKNNNIFNLWNSSNNSGRGRITNEK